MAITGYVKRKKPRATESRKQVVLRHVVRAGNHANRRIVSQLPTADEMLARIKEDNR